MLKNISIRNFKVFGEPGSAFTPGPVTLLIGPNGSGKSTLMQALLTLKQSLRSSTLMVSGPFIQLGTFSDVVHEQDTSRAMAFELTLEFGPDADSGERGILAPTHSIYELRLKNGELEFHQGTIRWREGELKLDYWAGSQLDSTGYVNVHPAFDVAFSVTPEIGHPIRRSGLSWRQEPVRGTETQIVQQVDHVLEAVPSQLERTHLIPAMRGIDRPGYSVDPNAPNVDPTQARGPEAQASAIINLLASQPTLAERVAEQLRRVLDRGDMILRPRLLEGMTMSEESISSGLPVNLVNEAFGMNQLLSPLLWLNKVPSGSLVGIEEPEIHLHPRSQVALCSLLAEIALEEQKQLILTTHSEHILIGFLNEVAEGRLSPSQLAVYSFSLMDGRTKVDRLQVNEYGQVEGGLSQFLEVDLASLGDLVKSRFKTN
jgi:energy-coupling factor transporter ATP-binding protein EcfA2